MEKTYNISIFTENTIGMLSRLSLIFTRRHVNIESISASPSEIEGVHRYTIVVNVTVDQVQKLVGQIEKQIEVLKAFFHLDEEVVYQEIALYKIPTSMLSNLTLPISTISSTFFISANRPSKTPFSNFT